MGQMKCENCGAIMTTGDGRSRVTCEYCGGSWNLLKKEPEKIPNKKIAEKPSGKISLDGFIILLVTLTGWGILSLVLSELLGKVTGDQAGGFSFYASMGLSFLIVYILMILYIKHRKKSIGKSKKKR